MKMPEELTEWTADEIAEAIDGVADLPGLYKRLWELLSEVAPKDRRAIGGEPGYTEEGQMVVEAPEEAIGTSTEDCAPAWWDKLTTEQQAHIVACAKREGVIE